MPNIQFKGKNLVVNHHLTAKFHHLNADKKQSVLARGANASLHDNLIVHGDNLLALKALMPTHAGKINCIYIDPPYNTGNEGWRYNDKVASPMIRAWMDKIVDRDDLTRHDKWLCMMYPRLMLLRELLAEDGVIFVSIDDNEVHRLRMLMDEIFGEDNFVANLIVRSNPGGRDYGGIALTHEHIMVYAKSELGELYPIPADEDALPLTDVHGKFQVRELRNRNVRFNSGNRPNLYYPFYVSPKKPDEHGLYEISLSGKKGWSEVYPMESGGVQTVWRWGSSKAGEEININVMAKQKRDGQFQIVEKYRKNTKRERSILDSTKFRNEQGTLALKSACGGDVVFDYPKSDCLIKRILELGAKEDAIILDSFAGSGTTAHAVLQLNKEDGGNRKFVLVECEDYAGSITAERVRRVIKGVKNARDQNLQQGFGGGFSFWTLGDAVEMKSILQGNLPSYEDLAKYVFFTATGEEWNLSKIKKSLNYIGASRLYDVYLFYHSDVAKLKETALTMRVADSLPKPSGGKMQLVFAPACFMNAEGLRSRKIKFCNLPFDIYRIAEKMPDRKKKL